MKPLIILDQSILRGADNLNRISEYVAKGDNIVILSNHQTEADPQVFLTCIIEVTDSEYSFGEKCLLSVPYCRVCNSPIISANLIVYTETRSYPYYWRSILYQSLQRKSFS